MVGIAVLNENNKNVHCPDCGDMLIYRPGNHYIECASFPDCIWIEPQSEDSLVIFMERMLHSLSDAVGDAE